LPIDVALPEGARVHVTVLPGVNERTALTSPEIEVFSTSGEIEDLQRERAQPCPSIVFVQAGELPHWQGHTNLAD